MTDAKESSNSIFSFLQGQVPAPQKLTIRSTDVVTKHGPIVHAINGNGYPTLLVPVETNRDNSIEWENKFVSFGYRTLTVEGKPQAFLALQCLTDRVLSQFGLLADDILDAVGANPAEADLLTRQTMGRWKELLRDAKPRLLGEAQLSGLYGELLFLDQLAFHHGAWVLRSWTGPLGNRHDFEFANASFEVKTTTSSNTMVVVFHGSRQLEATSGLPLYVSAYQVERTPQGESIQTVLQRLYDSGLDRLQMLRLLEKVGYFESDSEYYASHRFLALASKTLAVDNAFPRITHETMPMPGMLDGISALQYSVDLGPLQAFDACLEELTEAAEL